MVTRNVGKFRWLLGSWLALLPANLYAEAATSSSEMILYVDDSATGANDGSSWQNAYTDLQSALVAAEELSEAVVEIRVAEGTYKPSKRTDPADPRSSSFALESGMQLYGGFAGTESSHEQRNLGANVTILSGDLLGNDQAGFVNRTDNVYHVLTRYDNYPFDSGSVLLDGFKVQGGHSNRGTGNVGAALRSYGDIILQNCTFVDNWTGPTAAEGTVAHSNGGGAVAASRIGEQLEEPYIIWRNCQFLDNASNGTGGAVLLGSASITFSECLFQNNYATRSGAIGCEQIGSLFLDGCTFNSNESTGQSMGASPSGAGAVSLFYGADRLEIVDSSFTGNHGSHGGALLIDGGVYSARIDACTFSRNSAQNDGGAIYLSSANFELTNSEFTWNQAGVRGGGTAAFAGGDGLVKECSFYYNYAAEGGAFHASEHSVLLDNSSFRQNYATVGGAISNNDAVLEFRHSRFESNFATVGGAIAATGGLPTFRIFDSELIDNQAELYGGAIAGAIGELLVQRSTLVENSAGALGAAIIGAQGMAIQDSIVWHNTVDPDGLALQDEHAQIEGLDFASINYSIIEGWTGLFGGQENSGLDPLFDLLGPDGYPKNGDEAYRLSPLSPAANAGNPDFVASFSDTDLDGHARVLCGRVDIGAYESGIGDFDCDGVVDLIDIAGWVACAEGWGEGSDCLAMDFDNDGGFDLMDFAGMQRTIGN